MQASPKNQEKVAFVINSCFIGVRRLMSSVGEKSAFSWVVLPDLREELA